MGPSGSGLSMSGLPAGSPNRVAHLADDANCPSSVNPRTAYASAAGHHVERQGVDRTQRPGPILRQPGRGACDRRQRVGNDGNPRPDRAIAADHGERGRASDAPSDMPCADGPGAVCWEEAAGDGARGGRCCHELENGRCTDNCIAVLSQKRKRFAQDRMAIGGLQANVLRTGWPTPWTSTCPTWMRGIPLRWLVSGSLCRPLPAFPIARWSSSRSLLERHKPCA